MAARDYQLHEFTVLQDAKDPKDRLVKIVAYGRTGDTKPDESNYKIAMGSYIVNQDTLDIEFWDPDNGWESPDEGSDT